MKCLTSSARLDEIGDMSRSLEVFKQAAVEKLEAERQLAENVADREERQAKQAEKDARIQAEIDAAVTAASAGDFSQRVDTDGIEGIMQALGNSMNLLLETVDRGLGEAVTIMAALAEGDLTRRMVGDYQGSFLQLKEDSNNMAEKISEIVGNIVTVTGSVRTSTGEIDTGATELATRAESQAASLEEIAAAMEQISATVKTNAENAMSAKSLAVTTRGRAESGREVVSETVQAMSDIRESATEIGEIVNTIEAIAFQTNLLALNAAVEAARRRRRRQGLCSGRLRGAHPGAALGRCRQDDQEPDRQKHRTRGCWRSPGGRHRQGAERDPARSAQCHQQGRGDIRSQHRADHWGRGGFGHRQPDGRDHPAERLAGRPQRSRGAQPQRSVANPGGSGRVFQDQPGSKSFVGGRQQYGGCGLGQRPGGQQICAPERARDCCYERHLGGILSHWSQFRLRKSNVAEVIIFRELTVDFSSEAAP